MKPIQFAIAGCGNIGKRHLAVTDAEEKAEIVALCDTSAQKAQHYSELYGNIPAYTDYAQMLRETEAEVVSICTPHHLHKEMAIAAAEAGKHILCEKPMALTPADCDAMIAAADRNQVGLWVVKQNRYNVPIQLTAGALQEGYLGRIFLVKCDVLWNRHQGYYNDSPWRGHKATEGGALFTQVSHFIDLLVWWFGDVESARTQLRTQNHAIDFEDTGVSILDFPGGTMAELTWTTNVFNKNFEGSLTIIGEQGTIKIGGRYLNKVDFWDVEGYPLPENINYVDTPNVYDKYQGTSSNHHKVIRNLCAKMHNEEYSLVDGREGKRTVSAIEAIYAAYS